MKQKGIGVVVLLLGATLFFMNRVIYFRSGFLERYAANITYPVLVLSDYLSRPIRYLIYKRKNYKELSKHCKALEEEREDLLQENVKLRGVLHFDSLSKELRTFLDRYNLEDAIMGRVLLRTLSADEHAIIVNRGSRHGVIKDMVAIYKFQLVGRVSEVYANHSKIICITDRRSKVASFANTSEASGIVNGSNEVNHCQLRYVSHLEKIHPKDLVISSGKGLVFPYGFCLGKVLNCETNDVCHSIEMETLLDFQTLQVCALTNISKMNIF
jgi:rod shape-determining protein MreC